MKECIWKYRNLLGGIFILLIQLLYFWFKLITAGQEDLQVIVDVFHILLTSALVSSLFSRKFESFLEKRLYGEFRKNWKDVRVMYTDSFAKGMGEAYPREPTLLIHALSFDDHNRPPNLTMHRPMLMSFNSAYVYEPDPDENKWDTGNWSELQTMVVGLPKMQITRVGFPNTLTKVGGIPDKHITAFSEAHIKNKQSSKVHRFDDPNGEYYYTVYKIHSNFRIAQHINPDAPLEYRVGIRFTNTGIFEWCAKHWSKK